MGTWVHHLLIFAIVVVHMCIICSGNKKDEKRALLCFKEELQAPKYVLSSWVDGVDCCSEWEGVVCDNVTGHVIELHPTAPRPYLYHLKGKLSSCLLELKELRRLDLSDLKGYFPSGTPIPSFIGSFANLQYLDLSDSGFQGFIPHQLGNLSTLRTLRLGFNYGLKADSLEWLSRLSSLQILDLSDANLSMVHNWHEVITMLPSLRELYLPDCRLPKETHSHIYAHHNTSSSLLQILDFTLNEFNSVIPKWIFNLNNLVSLGLSECGFRSPFPDGPWNFTSLNTLDISNNKFNGSLPSQLFGLTNLVSLNIEWNQFQGPLPSGLLNLTSLKFLDASDNDLNSNMPYWIYNFTTLESLHLRDCQLQGTISNSISNLTSLSSLDLSGNMLTGEIPKEIGQLSKLQYLHLSSNMLMGEIPKQIGQLNKLQHLSLSTNMLTGEIPNEIGQLNKLQLLDLTNNKLCGPLPDSIGYSFPMMEELSISHNMLEGIVMESHFVNLTKLKTLDASGNKLLILDVSPNWTPPFQLDSLGLSGLKLGPQFPLWLQSQRQITKVDISNAGIESDVPTWFWNFCSELYWVNISHNQLRGQIENISLNSIPMGVQLVYLGSNQFSGPLPHISSNITELDLSNNLFSGDVFHFLCHPQNSPNELKILHLGGNRLSGEIPDCWMHWPNLMVINLNKNRLIGSIPDSIGHFNALQSLDLHDNMLSGNIPWSIKNCFWLQKVDLGQNRFTGKIPRWLGTSLSNLRFLRLRSNNFYGELPLELCHLISLAILDLSHNKLFGVIPKCLNNLTSMIYEDGLDREVIQTFEYSYTKGGYGENALVVTKGNEYEYDNTILLLIAAMDLSSNNFTGNIPTELTNLVQLRSLNLSYNNLTGNIPSEMGNMKLIESLDLSRNHLSGEIPLSFSSLSFLEDLDLSYNNLSGHIPSGTQLQGFSASCYINNNLCGPPISKGCSADTGEIPKHQNNANDNDDDDGVDWFYVSMAIGFAVGLWGVGGSLFFENSWRIAYFKFIDDKLKSFSAWTRARKA